MKIEINNNKIFLNQNNKKTENSCENKIFILSVHFGTTTYIFYLTGSTTCITEGQAFFALTNVRKR